MKKEHLCQECIDCEREEAAQYHVRGRKFRDAVDGEKGDRYSGYVCGDHLHILLEDGAELDVIPIEEMES
jgi:hypothetical protein